MGVLDIIGILLFGFIASIGATALNGSAPTTILGMTLPRLDTQGVLTLVLVVLGVFDAEGGDRDQPQLGDRPPHRQDRGAQRHPPRPRASCAGGLEHAKRYSKAEFQYAITQASNWAFTGILNNVAGIVSESFLLILVAIAFFLVDPLTAVIALAFFGGVIVGMQFFIGRSLKRAGKTMLQTAW